MTVPMPMECHPAYADQLWLMDWLNSEGQFADRHVIMIPKPINADPVDDKRTLTKQKAWALAPYTGKPFVYMWFCATDELGRSIAGKSWIEYLPWNPTMGCAPY